MSVDPYRPSSAVTDGTGCLWKDMVMTIGKAQPILPADPSRLWFSVLGAGDDDLVMPWGDAGEYGWFARDPLNGQPTLFHNASYPGMVILNQYLTVRAVTTYRIIWFATKNG